MNGIIEPGRLESHANSNKSIHLVVLLSDRIVLRVLLEVLGPRNIDQDVTEHANGIGVSPHHHVRKSNIIVCCEVSCHDSCKHGLLVEFDVVKSLECQAEVSKQAVYPQ